MVSRRTRNRLLDQAGEASTIRDALIASHEINDVVYLRLCSYEPL
jgi:hypothetical protein